MPTPEQGGVSEDPQNWEQHHPEHSVEKGSQVSPQCRHVKLWPQSQQ